MIGPASSTVPVKTLAPESAAAELTTLREHPGLYDDAHPEHGAITQRMNALTARARGDAVPPLTSAPPPAATPAGSAEELAQRLAGITEPQAPATVAASALPGFTAPSGEELDVDAVVALRGLELTHDVPVAELTAMANEYTAAWARRDDVSEARLDQRDALLLEAWKDDFELHLAHAEEMAQRLPSRVREHAKRAGMFRDALIWIKLAALWERTAGRPIVGAGRTVAP